MSPRVAAVLCVGLLAAGCGSTGAGSATPGPTAATQLQRAGTSPYGTHRVVCRLGADRVAIDLPRTFVRGLPRDYDSFPGCSWHRDVTVVVDPKDHEQDYDLTEIVSLSKVSAARNLQREYAEQEPFEVKGDTPGGDDSVLHLTLRRDVPTYGGTRGDRLSYWCFCDGQNTIYRAVQAAGVRLTWESAHGREAITDRQLGTALTHAGTVTG